MINSESSDFLKQFGHQVQTLRLRKNLTISELADKCGLKEEQIENLEQGHWDCTLDIALLIANALDEDIRKLF